MPSLINKLNSRIPTQQQLANQRSLKWLMPLLKKRRLWLIKRRSVANAFFVGLFSAFTPWPCQMFQAALMSIIFNANVPIAVSLVWITNPVTMGPIFYATYKLGAFILNVEEVFPEFQLSLAWMMDSFLLVWKPLLLGSFLCATIIATSAWSLSHILWHKNTLKKRYAKTR